MSLSAQDIAEMMEDTDVDEMVELGHDLIFSILERTPIDVVKAKVDAGGPLWFQDDEGISALHAAVYVENTELVRFLIQNGALWNAVDNQHNSPGDIALSLNTEGCYTIIRDAGIRSELLLTLLASRETLSNSPLSLVLKATDTTAAGSTESYLASRLRFEKDAHGQEICLLTLEDEDEVGVMMGWERGIMQETVRLLCHDHENLNEGLKILNVGFGLGIIDTFFEELPKTPAQHVIIEAHPDVLKHMRELGWYDKPHVKILEGKWQDFIESEELLGVGGFDVIYTDTFSEDYKELHNFFGHLPDLLAGPESRFSFFHGLGATNATFYDVYTHVSELHLAEVGMDVSWSDVDVFADSGKRWGTTREYFGMRLYRLPIGSMRAV